MAVYRADLQQSSARPPESGCPRYARPGHCCLDSTADLFDPGSHATLEGPAEEKTIRP